LLRIYTGINFFLIKRHSNDPIKIMKGAESFYSKKGKTGALLIHGFTSSPKELEELGKILTKKNLTVYTPLLPGHGTSPERLVITKYYQWIEAVEEAIKVLEKTCDKIYLIGNSFGGNLALVSSNKSKKIKGVVTLGTPIHFRREKINRFFILPILKRIKLFQKKKYKKGITNINKKRVCYNSIPLIALGHLLKVVNISKKSVRNIKKPLLVIQTKNDTVVDKSSGEYIINNSKSKIKKLVTIPESYHVFILDKHRKKAYAEILKFIK